ncbi:MAG: S8 family serine peptidase, partial [Dehalococcoidia bacterium]
MGSSGEIVIRFRPGVPKRAIRALNVRHGVQTLEVQPRSGLRRLALPPGASLDAVLAAYRSSPLTAEVGPSLTAQAFEVPNDTNYSYQWHMHNTDGGAWAEAAWDLSTAKGAGVVVAVIDTGAAYEDYEDSYGPYSQSFKLAPDLATTPFVAPKDFVNNDLHANDDNGHGSHIIGTIAQDTNNGYGVAGIANQTTIMPLKALDISGFGSDADLVEAIYYAVDNGADVINMSLGFPGTGAPDSVSGEVCTEIVGLNAALDYAYGQGVVVVAASGNEGAATVSCPAAYPTVIATGATVFDGTLASYSNTGDALAITAPGGNPNADDNNDGFSDGVLQETFCYDSFSTLILNLYDTFCDVFISGTSMATAHATGAAALLLGEDPTLTPAEVRFYLESTARDRGSPGWDIQYGSGVLEIRAALEALTGNGPPTAATWT